MAEGSEAPRDIAVSVIVPVFNMVGGRRLETCLDSLAAQTLAPIEFVCVDDASTDGSLDVLRRYEREDPERFRVIASPVNVRQGGARNLGMKAARGEYLGFVDSDDFVDPTMFDKLFARALETGADVVQCAHYVTTGQQRGEGTPVDRIPDAALGPATDARRALRVMDTGGGPWTKIVRRDLVVDGGLWFPDDIFYEDNAICPLWMLVADRFEKVPEPLYYYHRHPGATTRLKNDPRFYDRMTTARLLLENAKRLGLYEANKEALDQRFIDLYYVGTLRNYRRAFDRLDVGVLDELRREAATICPGFRRSALYASMPRRDRLRVAVNDLSPRLYAAVPERVWRPRPVAWTRRLVRSAAVAVLGEHRVRETVRRLRGGA